MSHLESKKIQQHLYGTMKSRKDLKDYNLEELFESCRQDLDKISDLFTLEFFSVWKLL